MIQHAILGADGFNRSQFLEQARQQVGDAHALLLCNLKLRKRWAQKAWQVAGAGTWAPMLTAQDDQLELPGWLQHCLTTLGSVPLCSFSLENIFLHAPGAGVSNCRVPLPGCLRCGDQGSGGEAQGRHR